MTSIATSQTLSPAIQALQVENARLMNELTLKDRIIQSQNHKFHILQLNKDKMNQDLLQYKERIRLLTLQIQELQSTIQKQSIKKNTNDTLTDQNIVSKEWQLYSIENQEKMISDMSDFSTDETLDRLSKYEFEAIQRVQLLTNSYSSTNYWEQIFPNASMDVIALLQQYYTPKQVIDTNLNTCQTIQWFSRVSSRPAIDYKIVCEVKTHVNNLQGKEMKNLIPKAIQGENYDTNQHIKANDIANISPLKHRVISVSGKKLKENMVLVDCSTDFHEFDCVEMDTSKRQIVNPHGLRYLHPTKAIYISDSLPVDGSQAMPSNRSSTLFKRSGTTNTKVPATSLSNASDFERSRAKRASLTNNKRRYTFAASRSNSAHNLLDQEKRELAQQRKIVDTTNGNTGSKADATPRKVKSIMGSMLDRLHRPKPLYPPLSEETVCDGCGRGPLSHPRVRWVCRTCRLQPSVTMEDPIFELCEKCYGQGIHGMEKQSDLFERIEELVIHKCASLAVEKPLMKLLRIGICKENLKKFSFCLTWIADLLQCKQTKDLRARALEISQIHVDVRVEFVSMLTKLLETHRPDIELLAEWESAENTETNKQKAETRDSSSSSKQSTDNSSGQSTVETLRIWVKDIPERKRKDKY